MRYTYTLRKQTKPNGATGKFSRAHFQGREIFPIVQQTLPLSTVESISLALQLDLNIYKRDWGKGRRGLSLLSLIRDWLIDRVFSRGD
jgi:hypothetical protein